MTPTHTAELLQHAQRVLLAGDASDIPTLEAILALLPAKAYGQVFIEVFDAGEIRAIPAPRRVNVTWLPRIERSLADGSDCCAERGQALGRAVHAWLAEWDLGAELDGDVESMVWIGGQGSDYTYRLSETLSQESAGTLHWLGTGELDPGH